MEKSKQRKVNHSFLEGGLQNKFLCSSIKTALTKGTIIFIVFCV